MRLVILGAGGPRKTETSILRGARALGHECRLVNVVGWSRYAGKFAGRAIRYLTDGFEPDFILLTRHAILTGPTLLRELLRGRRAAFWYFDLLPRDEVIALGRIVGCMYVTYLDRVESYRAAGIDRVRFLPQGVDPERDRPAASAPPGFSCDTSFVGSGQYPYRYTVLRAVAGVSRLQIRGPGWEGAPADLPLAGGAVYGKRLAQVIRGAAISLGASSYPEQDAERASASNRMWKILGCGGFYLGRHVPDIESFAVHDRHCAWYRDPAEAAAMVRHYLADPEQRARIARTGREHALRNHTYAHRLELLLAGKEYEVPGLAAPHTSS